MLTSTPAASIESSSVGPMPLTADQLLRSQETTLARLVMTGTIADSRSGLVISSNIGMLGALVASLSSTTLLAAAGSRLWLMVALTATACVASIAMAATGSLSQARQSARLAGVLRQHRRDAARSLLRAPACGAAGGLCARSGRAVPSRGGVGRAEVSLGATRDGHHGGRGAAVAGLPSVERKPAFAAALRQGLTRVLVERVVLDEHHSMRRCGCRVATADHPDAIAVVMVPGQVWMLVAQPARALAIRANQLELFLHAPPPLIARCYRAGAHRASGQPVDGLWKCVDNCLNRCCATPPRCR